MGFLRNIRHMSFGRTNDETKSKEKAKSPAREPDASSQTKEKPDRKYFSNERKSWLSNMSRKHSTKRTQDEKLTAQPSESLLKSTRYDDMKVQSFKPLTPVNTSPLPQNTEVDNPGVTDTVEAASGIKIDYSGLRKSGKASSIMSAESDDRPDVTDLAQPAMVVAETSDTLATTPVQNTVIPKTDETTITSTVAPISPVAKEFPVETGLQDTTTTTTAKVLPANISEFSFQPPISYSPAPESTQKDKISYRTHSPLPFEQTTANYTNPSEFKWGKPDPFQELSRRHAGDSSANSFMSVSSVHTANVRPGASGFSTRKSSLDLHPGIGIGLESGEQTPKFEQTIEFGSTLTPPRKILAYEDFEGLERGESIVQGGLAFAPPSRPFSSANFPPIRSPISSVPVSMATSSQLFGPNAKGDTAFPNLDMPTDFSKTSRTRRKNRYENPTQDHFRSRQASRRDSERNLPASEATLTSTEEIAFPSPLHPSLSGSSNVRASKAKETDKERLSPVPDESEGSETNDTNNVTHPAPVDFRDEWELGSSLEAELRTQLASVFNHLAATLPARDPKYVEMLQDTDEVRAQQATLASLLETPDHLVTSDSLKETQDTADKSASKQASVSVESFEERFGKLRAKGDRTLGGAGTAGLSLEAGTKSPSIISIDDEISASALPAKSFLDRYSPSHTKDYLDFSWIPEKSYLDFPPLPEVEGSGNLMYGNYSSIKMKSRDEGDELGEQSSWMSRHAAMPPDQEEPGWSFKGVENNRTTSFSSFPGGEHRDSDYFATGKSDQYKRSYSVDPSQDISKDDEYSKRPARTLARNASIDFGEEDTIRRAYLEGAETSSNYSSRSFDEDDDLPLPELDGSDSTSRQFVPERIGAGLRSPDSEASLYLSADDGDLRPDNVSEFSLDMLAPTRAVEAQAQDFPHQVSMKDKQSVSASGSQSPESASSSETIRRVQTPATKLEEATKRVFAGRFTTPEELKIVKTSDVKARYHSRLEALKKQKIEEANQMRATSASIIESPATAASMSAVQTPATITRNNSMRNRIVQAKSTTPDIPAPTVVAATNRTIISQASEAVSNVLRQLAPTMETLDARTELENVGHFQKDLWAASQGGSAAVEKFKREPLYIQIKAEILKTLKPLSVHYPDIAPSVEEIREAEDKVGVVDHPTETERGKVQLALCEEIIPVLAARTYHEMNESSFGESKESVKKFTSDMWALKRMLATHDELLEKPAS